jgi:chemotaxis protein CheD
MIAQALSTQIVGVAEMKVSRAPVDVLATYSLGSCIGVSMFDLVARVGGLVHCMLPSSTIDPEKARVKPEMFVDTGVGVLLGTLYEMGAEKKNLIVKVAGASKLMDTNGVFKIGERNYNILKKVLAKNGIEIAGEDIGGTVARTMFLHMSTGQTLLKVCGKETTL